MGTLEARWLADKRLPQPGQNVILDAPPLARFVLRHCLVTTLDGLVLGLRTDDPLPRLATGTLVVLSQFGRRRRLDGAVMEMVDTNNVLVRLLPLPEHRAHPRFSVGVDVSLASFGEPGALGVAGLTLDLSEGGARVRTHGPINVSSRAVLSLQLPDGSTITSIVEPLESAVDVHDGGYQTRVRFVSMPKNDRSLLRAYLDRMP